MCSWSRNSPPSCNSSVITEDAGIDVAQCDPRLYQLLAKTDVRTLSAALDQELTTLGVAVPAEGGVSRARVALSSQPVALATREWLYQTGRTGAPEPRGGASLTDLTYPCGHRRRSFIRKAAYREL